MKSSILFALVLISGVLSANTSQATVCSNSTPLVSRQLKIDPVSWPITAGKPFVAVLSHTEFEETTTHAINCVVSTNPQSGALQCGQDQQGLHLGFLFLMKNAELQRVFLLEEFFGGYGSSAEKSYLTCKPQ